MRWSIWITQKRYFRIIAGYLSHLASKRLTEVTVWIISRELISARIKDDTPASRELRSRTKQTSV